MRELVEQSQETSSAVEKNSPRRLTKSRGLAAMAGEELGGNIKIQDKVEEKAPEIHKGQVVEGEAVKTPVPIKKLVEQMPPLTDSETSDLTISAEHANLTKATRFHAKDGGYGSIHEYHRIRSEISEDLARYQVENAARADQYSVGGHNFPGYDILGTNEVCSVKCYSLKVDKNAGPQPRYGAYQAEFMNIIDPNSKANQKSAERLLKIRENNPAEWEKLQFHLPKSVVDAKNHDAMARELADHSTMRLPEDQLDGVVKNLTAYHKNKLMIEKNMTEEEAVRYANIEVFKRVLSVDPRYQTAHYQGIAAKVLSSRPGL